MKYCYNCKHAIMTGGDSIPYGSTFAQTPYSMEGCNNEFIVELSDDEYEEYINNVLEGKTTCEFFKEE